MPASNYVIIYGSVRAERAGLPVALFIKRLVEERGRSAVLIDPLEHKLPVLERRLSDYAPGEAPAELTQISNAIESADGIILVSAEYNHSFPPALKNLLDHFRAEYQHKPSAICTYSVGSFGGVRAASALRDVISALGAPPVPTMLPIPTMQQNFDAQGGVQNPQILKGAARFLDDLDWWADAAAAQRAKS